MAENGMIEPYQKEQVRTNGSDERVISYYLDRGGKYQGQKGVTLPKA